MILATHGIVGSQIVQLTTLLDLYPNAAAAYSLRLLRSGYTGSAIRVRRASDNTEQDIGFVNNVLDTSTLTSFCSGTNGFVKTWYDQSGNGNDATQTTAANQPQIVSSGSVILENSQPSLQFDGSNDNLSFPQIFFSSHDISNFTIQTTKANVGQRYLAHNRSEVYYRLEYFSGDKLLRFNARSNLGEVDVSSTTINPLNVQALSEYYLRVLNNMQAYWNGTNLGTNIFGVGQTVVTNNNFIGTSRSADGFFFNGTIQEVIMYPSDQSSNRTGIELNINNFYSIY